MKRFLMIAAMGLAAPLAASADDFSDFRIPEHKANRWDVAVSGQAVGQNQTVSPVDLRDTRGSATLFTNAFWLKDSDPLRRVTTVSGSVLAAGADRHREQPGFSERRTGRDAAESWLASVEERRYPWAVPLGLAWSAQGSGDYAQSWDRDADTFTLPPPVTTKSVTSDERWAYRTSVVASARARFRYLSSRSSI